MELEGHGSEIMCRAFSLTLKEAARTWFRGLKPRSISSFSQLSEIFLSQFMGSIRIKKPASHLMDLKQQHGETIKEFTVRFTAEAVQTEGYTEEKGLTALIAGITSEKFRFALNKSPPKTMAEFQAKAQKYINAEEVALTRHGAQGKKRKPEGTSSDKKYRREQRDRSPKRPYSGKYHNYTPLNRSHEKVLMEIKHKPYVKWPAKIKSDREKRDKSKFCYFHKDHGHRTQDCISLRDHIEALIRKGHLQDYVARKNRSPERATTSSRQKEQPHRQTNQEDAEPAGEIRTIVGGPACGGDSQASRKAYTRKASKEPQHIYWLEQTPSASKISHLPISFSLEDAAGIHFPHEDSIVVALKVSNYLTHRIMVDR